MGSIYKGHGGKLMKSFFWYMHDDLSGDPDWKKCGIGMTPYSVVRARQKFCSKQFSLNHLYFGNPHHIYFLESEFKKSNYKKSGSHINEISSQTELFKMSELEILVAIDKIITDNNLHVSKLELPKPYSAANSGECPFDIPSETVSYDYLKHKITKSWGKFEEVKITKSTVKFNEIFKIL